MMRKTIPVLFFVLSAVVALPFTAAAGENLWLHVKVDEGHGAKVSVNLPLSLVEKGIPLLPTGELHDLHIVTDDMDFEIEELRALWQEVMSGPDMTYVTVEDGSEQVKVWKESQFFHVQVRDSDAEENVDVKLPLAVVDALLSEEEVNLQAAVRALVEQGHGEFVTIRDRNDTVRVWIDDSSESR